MVKNKYVTKLGRKPINLDRMQEVEPFLSVEISLSINKT